MWNCDDIATRISAVGLQWEGLSHRMHDRRSEREHQLQTELQFIDRRVHMIYDQQGSTLYDLTAKLALIREAIGRSSVSRDKGELELESTMREMEEQYRLLIRAERGESATKHQALLLQADLLLQQQQGHRDFSTEEQSVNKQLKQRKAELGNIQKQLSQLRRRREQMVGAINQHLREQVQGLYEDLQAESQRREQTSQRLIGIVEDVRQKLRLEAGSLLRERRMAQESLVGLIEVTCLKLGQHFLSE